MSFEIRLSSIKMSVFLLKAFYDSFFWKYILYLLQCYFIPWRRTFWIICIVICHRYILYGKWFYQILKKTWSCCPTISGHIFFGRLHRCAVKRRLVPFGNCFKHMIKTAILSAVIRRINKGNIRLYFFSQNIWILPEYMDFFPFCANYFWEKLLISLTSSTCFMITYWTFF